MEIVPKVLCVFRHERSVLVIEGHDPEQGVRYLRPLGGAINFGERSAEAIVREIREEIDAEISDLQYLGVCEAIFSYRGRQHHEIIFIYDARFRDERLYDVTCISGRESDGSEVTAFWRTLDSLEGGQCRFVPEGLMELLKQTAPPGRYSAPRGDGPARRA